MLRWLRHQASTSRGIFPALAFALLLGAWQDLNHQHDTPADGQQCYACHFSPDLGLAAADGVPGPVVAAPARWTAAAPRAPRNAAIAAYDARGPPLLS